MMATTHSVAAGSSAGLCSNLLLFTDEQPAVAYLLASLRSPSFMLVRVNYQPQLRLGFQHWAAKHRPSIMLTVWT